MENQTLKNKSIMEAETLINEIIAPALIFSAVIFIYFTLRKVNREDMKDFKGTAEE